jgi:putative PIN family toxin of toxin-antitoxin system
MMPKRLVIDTNVLVSAALMPHSLPASLVRYAFEFSVLLSTESTLMELDTVLHRPKFDRYVSMQERKRFYEDVKGAAEYLDVHTWTPVCRDPKDDKFLALAVVGMADFLITGDQDLLVLHPFQKVAIVTPQDFLALQTT